MLKNILELQEICHSYGKNNARIDVLKNASIAIAPNQVVALTGSSGSGKSTLLHIAGVLEVPCSGRVLLDGVERQNLSENQKSMVRLNNIGFVYQFHNLLADFTALENIMMPLLLKGQSKKEAEDRSIIMLEKLGLSKRAKHLPSMLSGGEQQRVAVGRGLISQPKIIIADEPTGNLDSNNSMMVLNLFFELAREQNSAILLATHDEKIASKADKVLVIENGEIR
jgi:lipoprotein-releasing system ATP-binding protein